MNPKKALITGVTGQDGSYLAEFLLEKGYEVHGVVRRASTFNRGRIEHLLVDGEDPAGRFFLHYGDLSDGSSLSRLLRGIQPQEIYNLGAQSHVRTSFDQAEYTGDVTGLGTVRLLEAVRELGFGARIYQASSSELFGKALETPQNEKTPFYPRSPYAAAKAYAYHITRNYRDSYGIFAVNGILFNHESPRRGESFVTRKITRSAARIRLGLQDSLSLGNLDPRRDWGYAPEYVEAMWMMLQRDEPEDFVIATGETHSVRDFLDEAFGLLELDWEEFVRLDPQYLRPAEVDLLVGDPSKASRELGWSSQVGFKELVRIMVEADLQLAEREAHVAGFEPGKSGVRLREDAR